MAAVALAVAAEAGAKAPPTTIGATVSGDTAAAYSALARGRGGGE